MSVPGVLNRKKGIVVEAPNLGMKDFPLEEELSREFGKPVILENDVNAGVYGEFINGAAKGYEHVLGFSRNWHRWRPDHRRETLPRGFGERRRIRPHHHPERRGTLRMR
jgi:hypothetical protein